MNGFQQGWYVIYTRPRHEKKVAGQLTETGIDNYLPVVKKIQTWSDRKKCVEVPLFPSYVFVYLPTMHCYFRGMGLNGVLYYVRTGKQVARIAETVINNIKLITTRTNDFEISPDRFQPGQKLVISKGALTGLYCEIIQYKGKQKVLVRVDLLQRNILLTVSADLLVAI